MLQGFLLSNFVVNCSWLWMHFEILWMYSQTSGIFFLTALADCRALMKNVPALCKRNKKFLKKWMHSSDLVYCPVPLVIPFRLSYKQPLFTIVFLFVCCCPTAFYKFTQKPNRVAVCLWCSIYVYASMRITP